MGLTCPTRDRLHEFTKNRSRYLTWVNETGGSICPTRYPLKALFHYSSHVESQLRAPVSGLVESDAARLEGPHILGHRRVEGGRVVHLAVRVVVLDEARLRHTCREVPVMFTDIVTKF